MAEYTPPSGPNPGGGNAGQPAGYQAPGAQPSPYGQAYSPPPPGPAAPPRERPEIDSIPRDVSGKKIAAGVLGILLGSLGIHKFILGYTSAGLVMLLLSVLSCGILGTIFAIIGIIEGIVYLTKSDEDFYRTYIVGKRTWF